MSANRLATCLALVFVIGCGLPTVSFAQNETVGFVELLVNTRTAQSFFPVVLDDQENPYPRFDALMQALEMPASFDSSLQSAYGFLPDGRTAFSLSLSRGTVEIGEVAHRLSPDMFRLVEGQLYVRYSVLQIWLPLSVRWDLDAYRLIIRTDYPLPSVERKRRESQRLRLLEQQRQRYEPEALEREVPWFDPGMFELRGTGSGGEGNPDGFRLNLRGVHRFLKGDLEYSVTKSRFDSQTSETQLDYARLTYYDPLRTRQAQFGDTYSVFSPLVLDTETFRGGSFYSGGSQLRFGRTTLIGNAPPDSTVDLYQRGVLVDFTTADSKGFYRFEDVLLSVSSTLFEVRIYTPDGRQLERFHEVLSDEEMLSKGRLATTGGAGRGTRAGGDFDLAGGELRYGLADWLTLGAYVLQLENYVIEFDVIEQQTTGGALFLVRPFDLMVLLGERAQGSGEDGAATRWNVNFGFSGLSLELDWKGFEGEYAPPKRTRSTAFTANDRADAVRTVRVRSRVFEVNLNLESTITDFGETRIMRKDQIAASRRFSSLFSANLTFDHERANEEGFAESGADSQQLLAVSRITTLMRLEALVQQTQVLNGQDFDQWRVSILKNHRTDSPLSFSVSHTRFSDRENLSEASVGYLFSERFRVLAQADTDDRWLALMEYTLPFRVSGDGFETLPPQSFGRAGLKGTVFVDENGNSVRDEGEESLPDVVISGPGLKDLVSDDSGAYRGWGLSTHGPTEISIDLLTVDALFVPARQKFPLAARPGELITADVPLVPAGGLDGMFVLEDLADISPANGLDVTLVRLDGSEAARVTVEFDGAFVFDNLPPGKYLIVPDPQQFSEAGLAVSPERLEIELPPGPDPAWLSGLELKLVRVGAAREAR